MRSMPIAYRSVYMVYLRSMRAYTHMGVCLWCIYAVCVYTYGLYVGVISGVSCSTTQYAFTQMGYMEE